MPASPPPIDRDLGAVVLGRDRAEAGGVREVVVVGEGKSGPNIVIGAIRACVAVTGADGTAEVMRLSAPRAPGTVGPAVVRGGCSPRGTHASAARVEVGDEQLLARAGAGEVGPVRADARSSGPQ